MNSKIKNHNKIYKYKKASSLILKPNFLMIILFLFFNNIIKGYSKKKIIISSSIITIKINQTGMQNIFNGEDSCYRDMFDPPNKVIINNIEQNPMSARCYLEKEENIIKLKWNDARENWGCLFKDCSNINFFGLVILYSFILILLT